MSPEHPAMKDALNGCGCRIITDGIVPATDHDDDPTCLQKIKHEGSVLSLAVSDEYIFAGTQRKNILVSLSVEESNSRYGIFIRMNGGRR